MSPETHGTGFAPYPPDEGAGADSGKKGAGGPAIPSVFEVPAHAAPACLCLRFLPHWRGNQFQIQIVDLETGTVLEESAPRAFAELPALLAQTRRWVFCR